MQPRRACLTNAGKLQLDVEVIDLGYLGPAYGIALSAEIRGEFALTGKPALGAWTKLQVYSLSPEEFLAHRLM